jgi:hypothetical protein
VGKEDDGFAGEVIALKFKERFQNDRRNDRNEYFEY